MSRTAPLFSASPTVHDGANAGSPREVPLIIETPAAQWAYAVSFERTGVVPSSMVLVRVTIRVDRGSVGVGALNRARTSFVHEVVADAAPIAQSVEVIAADPADLGPLVVRNVWDRGASRAVVLDIPQIEIVDVLDHEIDAPGRAGLSDPEPDPQWARHYGTNRLTVRERLRARRFEQLAGPETFTWDDGLAFEILPGDQLSRAVYLSGTYEPNTLRALRSFLRPGDVFIDVGANAGIVALAASQWVVPGGRVFAFEPSSREFTRLTRTLELNPRAPIVAIRAAVGASEGRAALRVAEAGLGGLNTLAEHFAYPDVGLAGIEMVDLVTLDGFVAQQGVSRVAAIKIDVEGAEVDVLRSARDVLARLRPVLAIEVFSRSLEAGGSTVGELERLLRDARYALFALDNAEGRFRPLTTLEGHDEQNVVGIPVERVNDGVPVIATGTA